MVKKNIIIIFILLIIIASPKSIADDNNKIHPCLNDFLGVIDSSNAEMIQSTCDSLYSDAGVESAILITNFSEDIDSYAINVFENNGIGSNSEDNGILIIINPEDDNNWIIIVGYGLEGVLNDAKLADIGRTYLEPALDEGEYGTAVYDTLKMLQTSIYESGEFKKEKNFWKDNWPLIAGIIILILVAIITRGAIMFLPGFKRGFGGGRTGGGRARR